MRMLRTIKVAAALVVVLALTATWAVAHPLQQDAQVRGNLKVGPSASSPKIIMYGSNGNATFAGTITATGGVVGGTSLGTFAAGTVGAPGMAFTGDSDTGAYRVAANDLGITAGGTKVADFQAGATVLTGTLTVSGAQTFTGATTCSSTLSTVGAATLASLVCTAGATFGGGYGSTGATISTAGVGQFNGALTVDGASTLTGAVACGDTLSSTGAATLASLVCTAAGTFGGGYGSTGCTIATTGNIQTNGTLTVDSAATLSGATEVTGDFSVNSTMLTVAAATGNTAVAGTLGVTGAATIASGVCTAGMTFGGGYGATGATISTAGVGQFNGALTTDGAATADNIVCTNAATFGGGYGSTGGTISTAGVGQFNGALTTDGALTADNVVCTNAATFGGGYGATGTTISTAGVGEFNGALTTDGTLTALDVAIGGGYGATGVTVTNAGNISTNGTLVVDGASQLATRATVVDADDRVVTSADYGKIIILTHATASAVTLPANGAAVGSQFWVALNGNDSLAATISAATADSLIGFNDAGLDSVTWGAGHRIGAMAWFWSDGTYWHVQNVGSGTMTYTS